MKDFLAQTWFEFVLLPESIPTRDHIWVPVPLPGRLLQHQDGQRAERRLPALSSGVLLQRGHLQAHTLPTVRGRGEGEVSEEGEVEEGKVEADEEERGVVKWWVMWSWRRSNKDLI